MQHQDTVAIDSYKREIEAQQDRIKFLQETITKMATNAVNSAQQIEVLIKQLEYQTGICDALKPSQRQTQTKTDDTIVGISVGNLANLNTANLLLRKEAEKAQYKAARTETQAVTNNALQDELNELNTTNLRLKTALENAEYKASEIEKFFCAAYGMFAPVFDDTKGDTVHKTAFYELRGYFELKMELIERMA